MPACCLLTGTQMGVQEAVELTKGGNVMQPAFPEKKKKLQVSIHNFGRLLATFRLSMGPYKRKMLERHCKVAMKCSDNGFITNPAQAMVLARAPGVGIIKHESFMKWERDGCRFLRKEKELFIVYRLEYNI